MIKLVLFDLDNTLYPTYKQVRQCRVQAVNAMIKAGLRGTKKELFKKLQDIVKELGSNSEKHFDTLVQRVMPEKSDREKMMIVSVGVTTYALAKERLMRPYDETKKVLHALKNKKVKIGVMTDGVPIKQWDKINRLGLRNDFKTNTWVTNDKSNGEELKRIISELKIKGSEILLVGDRKKSDIQAAKNAGTRSAQLMKGPYQKEEGPCPDYKIKNLASILKIISDEK